MTANYFSRIKQNSINLMLMLMTMMMMTMMRGDQVSGGRQGLAVIGRHALAKSDLKHDEANDQDDDDCR